MGRKRHLKPSIKLADGKIRVGGDDYIDFSSNDYLGLSNDADLMKVSLEEGDQMGSTGSRLLSGDYDVMHDLENALANWLGKPSVLIFNSGYQLNVGVISTLWGASDVIFMDRFVHASIVDGVRLSRAKFHRYSHQDYDHLEQLLKRYRSSGKKAVILTESVFSMDGDMSDISKLVALKLMYDCELYIDEAHAVGVFGSEGAGCVSLSPVGSEVDYVVGTFGKAFGSFGAFLGCMGSIRDYLISSCRSFIYSTALPLPLMYWQLNALERIKHMSAERQHILSFSKSLRDLLNASGFKVLGSSQIVPIVCESDEACLSLSDRLKSGGFWVPSIFYPTVPKDCPRLRFSVCATHDLKNIRQISSFLI